MKDGGWIPLDKNLISSLPKNRQYSKIEAMFSLSIDYDNSSFVSISGYSKLWMWSRNKVNKFLDDTGVEIIYSDKFSKQGGVISVKKRTGQGQDRDRTGTGQGQDRFIDSKGSCDSKDRTRTGQGQDKDRTRLTTKEPNPNPNPSLKKETKKVSFSDNSDEMRLSIFLENHILKNKQDFKKKNLQMWAKTFDLIIRKDNKKVDDIKSLILWTQSHSFWWKNILSPEKLRLQYDRLEGEKNNPVKSKDTGCSGRTLKEIIEDRDRKKEKEEGLIINHEDIKSKNPGISNDLFPF